MKPTPVTPSISTDLFRSLLDAEYLSPAMLVYAARKDHRRLPTLLLSVMEQEGAELGTGARDELRRAHERDRDYQDLYRAIAEDAECRVLKGPRLAERYPAGLRRAVGDLDLVVPDEKALWSGLRRALREREVSRILLALHGEEGRELTVEIHWPSEDDLLDGDASAEFNTAPLPGNFGTVRPRTSLPDDDWVASLLGLAEERFQRSFEVRDILDVHVLAASAPPVDTVVEAIRGYGREPEVLELLTRANDSLGTGTLTDLAEALVEPAEAEEARRASAAHGIATDPDETDVDRRFKAGLPVQGFMLRRADDRRTLTEARRHAFSRGWLLLTPVGDYLLCGGPVVAQDDYEAALRELECLGEI
ncbi:nucleotidyltransferase family protein [Nocardiopsis sp. NPDC101807]|uniref:nucleotidyltransferase family protein n=1 Tax=Nocardiopsis sp. NPDC101807 TaxID=3364339 RepID=UPI00380F8328